MPSDFASERHNWIMTGRSCLCAASIMGLLFFNIYEAGSAEARDDASPYTIKTSGQRLLY